MDVPPTQWKMHVYDRERFTGEMESCSPVELISERIIVDGMWERWHTQALLERDVFSGGHVFDIGAHVGWYTMLAASHGCSVTAVEADPENVSMIQRSAQLNGWEDRIEVRNEWVEQGWELAADLELDVDLIKVDIEGSDAHAISGLWPLIADHRVARLMVEISPVFSSGYPELVASICAAGYTAEVIAPTVYPLPSIKWVETCNQVDVLFTRK